MNTPLKRPLCLYIPPVSQKGDIDWIRKTAQALSQYESVILLDLVRVTRYSVREVFRMVRSAFLEDFSDWSMVMLIPGEQAWIKKINTYINMFFLKLVAIYKSKKIVMIVPASTDVHPVKQLLNPKLVIGDSVDMLAPYLEQTLEQDSDIVTTNTPQMYAYHAAHKKRVHMVSSGYFLKKTILGLSMVECFSSSSKNIICISTISNRLNFDLLDYLVTSLPTYTFTFFVPQKLEFDMRSVDSRVQVSPREAALRWERIVKRRNVAVITAKPNELLNIPFQAVAGIIPYETESPFTVYSHPIKYYLYSALGLPTVTVPIRFLSHKPAKHVSVASTHKQFAQALRRSSTKRMSPADRKKYVKSALQQTHEQKAADLHSLMVNYLGE